jgi:hypothetical protein
MDTDYKVFIIFYIDNFQVLYYKDNKIYTQLIIIQIKRVYKLYNIRDIE